MSLHILKPRFHLLVGLLITLATISPAQTSDIVCPGSWKQVSSSGPAPRVHHALAFEPRGPHGHVVLFGGFDNISDRKGDTWTWDGTVWIHAATADPSPRILTAMAYDFGLRQMVLFGGRGVPGDPDKDNQDTWKWNGTKWTEVAAGGGPAVRSAHGMAYDGARQRTVLFGGANAASGILGDTWEWDGTAWSQRSPASAPSPRGQFGMVYDSAHARTVLFGGHTCCPKDFGDTWTWDGTVWTHVTDLGPGGRSSVGMTYDSARHRTVLFGGETGPDHFGDTWEWDGVRWTQVASTGPDPRSSATLAYDKARGKAVLFGGANVQFQAFQDTWEWRGPIYACSGRPAGDLNCDHVVNHQDLTIIDAAVGLPACSAADPRDLNHDGKINAADAQLLANKCTKLGCK